ncbi:hypothetical protein UR09_04190 [Candidatus Nitromaritima sp. SCGC AAA799-A02]|nr:hypothetical protein UR09_04190 [Candidatus Nitromaritima sp. SCGC AAA799-A02]
MRTLSFQLSKQYLLLFRRRTLFIKISRQSATKFRLLDWNYNFHAKGETCEKWPCVGVALKTVALHQQNMPNDRSAKKLIARKPDKQRQNEPRTWGVRKSLKNGEKWI